MKNENEARKCSSLYHRNNKSIYYVSFKQAGKMKRILCFYWLPERSKQDGPLLVPRDLPRWILRPQLKIPLFGHIKNPLSRSRWLNNGLVLFCLFYRFRLVSESIKTWQLSVYPPCCHTWSIIHM